MDFEDAHTKFSTRFALPDFPVSRLCNRRLTGLYAIRKSCMAAGWQRTSVNEGMSNLSSCSSDSRPHRTRSTMLLAWKGIEEKDCSHASWQNREHFLVFVIHSHKITFSLEQRSIQLFPAPDHVWISYSGKSRMNWKNSVRKKCFCQAVVPGFVSESENFRRQKTVLLQLLLCGKRKKKK